jgi:hypothetical protein
MTLNASGPISLAGTTAGQSIEIELNGNGRTQISLNDGSVRTLAGVTTPNSTIIMPTNFYGKANTFTFSISSNTANANLRSLAIAAGWNGDSKVVANIGGIYIYSTSTGSPALTINGSFPNGVTVNNGGVIVGRGGDGGEGGGAIFTCVGPCCGYYWTPTGSSGAAGGTALSVSVPVTINNTNVIAGGGGGGGGGQGQYGNAGTPYAAAGGGGGGGRTSLTNSSGGAAGGYKGNSTPIPFYGYAGGAGTVSGAGGGGAGSYYNYCVCGCSGTLYLGGDGGGGGGWGSSGGTGGTYSYTYGYSPPPTPVGPFSGGAAGYAVSGNSNITWTAFGTRYGPIA